jgi:benzoate 4-monooxygenase
MRSAPALIAYPPAFQAIYSFNQSLEKGNFYDFSCDARTRIYNVFGIHTNEAHREHRRKVVGLTLSPGKVDVYDFVISKNVSYFCRLSETQASSVNGEIVNIAPYVHRYTFGAMVEVIFDEPICSQPSTSLIHLHQHLDSN